MSVYVCARRRWGTCGTGRVQNRRTSFKRRLFSTIMQMSHRHHCSCSRQDALSPPPFTASLLSTSTLSILFSANQKASSSFLGVMWYVSVMLTVFRLGIENSRMFYYYYYYYYYNYPYFFVSSHHSSSVLLSFHSKIILLCLAKYYFF